MTKKKISSVLKIVCVLLSIVATVNATGLRASEYLNAYSATVYADGNSDMSVDVIVYGADKMDKIGVQSLRIEEKYSENGSWHHYDTLYGSNDPDDFYDYGKYTFLNTFYFNGTPGYYYRVIATVYAGNSHGSDTGSTPSLAVRCKRRC